jgi:hypothetical protein
MKIRFQADNDLDQRIVVATKRLDSTIDFQTATALGLHYVTDPQVLTLAAKQGRILVSHDRKTLPKHFKTFVESSSSPGLIIVSQKTAIGKVAHWLHLLWAASDKEEFTNIIYELSELG